MDPQQELFSALLIALKEKYKNTGIDVYDTFLPPEGTAYPFVYLGATTQADQDTKDAIIGKVSRRSMSGTTIRESAVRSLRSC